MSKSKLNEYCQKNKLTFPEYTCTSVAEQTFKISAIWNGANYTLDETFPNKKSAEEAIAKVMLPKPKPLQTNLNTEISVLIIDLDNQWSKCKEIQEYPFKQVIAVGGCRCPVEKVSFNCNDTIIEKIESTHKDAADYRLCWLVAENYKKWETTTPIYIISSDFSVQNIANMLNDKGYNTKFYTSLFI